MQHDVMRSTLPPESAKVQICRNFHFGKNKLKTKMNGGKKPEQNKKVFLSSSHLNGHTLLRCHPQAQKFLPQ